MTSNKILTAFLKVVLFWYTVFCLLTSGATLFDGALLLFPSLLVGIRNATVGFACGSLAFFVIYMLREGNTSHALLPHSDGWIKYGIGKIPRSRNVAPNRDVSVIPEEFRTWFNTWSKDNKALADLFLSVAAYISSHKGVMAATDPTGHGGASLETHSWNVLREALAHQKKWEYLGQKTKTGTMAFSKQDKRYRFYPDPIIPLCAFAHDIGKIVCYKPDGRGGCIEVKHLHDEVGAKLLGTFEDFRHLSPADRKALTICVGYYHHPMAIPLNVDDRPRALTEFTLYVDVLAGKKEGGKFPPEGSQPDDEDEDEDEESLRISAEASLSFSENILKLLNLSDNNIKQPTTNAPVAVSGKKSGDSDRPATMEDAANANRDPETHEAKTLSVPDADEFVGIKRPDAELCDTAVRFMISKVIESGALNKGSGSARLGYKFKDLVYVQEQRLRNALYEKCQASMYLDKENQRIHAWTKALLWGLYDRGALYYKHDGKSYTPNSALFNITTTTKQRNSASAPSGMAASIIFRSGVSDSIEARDDCPRKPEIVGPFFGESSAFGKNKMKAQKDPVDHVHEEPFNIAYPNDNKEETCDNDVPFNNTTKGNQ